jgi:hypothetical protein
MIRFLFSAVRKFFYGFKINLGWIKETQKKFKVFYLRPKGGMV